MEAIVAPTGTNKASIISLVTGISTPTSYCVLSALFTLANVFTQVETDNIWGDLYFVIFGSLIILPFISAVTALATGILGLVKIKKTREKGKGFAILGIVLGSLSILLYLSFAVDMIVYLRSGLS